MHYSPAQNAFFLASLHGDLPPDAVEITPAHHAALLAAQAGGKRIVADENGYPVAQDPPAPQPPSADQIRAARVAEVQQHMDSAAQALGYDDIQTAVTYADEPAVPRFQAEGHAFRAWRSRVWAHCYQVLDEVQAGLRTIPTSEALIYELPELHIEYPPPEA